MSTSLNSVIILPGSRADFYCADGLSPVDKQNIQKIFNFGGQLKFANCGVENMWVAFQLAKGTMQDELENALHDSGVTSPEYNWYGAQVYNLNNNNHSGHDYTKLNDLYLAYSENKNIKDNLWKTTDENDAFYQYKKSHFHYNKFLFRVWLKKVCGQAIAEKAIWENTQWKNSLSLQQTKDKYCPGHVGERIYTMPSLI